MSSAERRPRARAAIRRSSLVAATGLALALTGVASAVDVAALIVVPEDGQSAEQARRDRYECHNWAVAQTGTTPVRVASDEARADTRAKRVDKVLAGAAIGAAVGSFIRGTRRHSRRDDVADAALGGAVLGAVAGAIAGKESASRAEAATDAVNDDYVRALSACLEGRGYSVDGGDPPPAR